jgi:hypothetical protein
VGGGVFVVPWRVGDPRPWTGSLRQGGHQCLGPRLEHRDVGGLAVPTWTPTGATTVWRDHQCPHGRLEVRSVISGIPVGDRHGLRIAFREVCPTEGTAGGVKMVAAQGDAFAGPHAQGQFRQEEVTAVGLGRIERAAELEAMEQLSPHAIMPHQLEGFAGKKLWGSRQGPMGKAEPIQHHAGYGFARCELLGWIRHEAGVEHGHSAQVVDDRREHASVVEAFHVHLFPE